MRTCVRVILTFVLSFSLAGSSFLAEGQRESAGQDLPGTIDGAVSPFSIPDDIAYELFLRALGASSSPDFAKKSGLDHDEVNALLNIAHSFSGVLNQYDGAIKSSEPGKVARLQAQKRKFIADELEFLPKALGSTPAAKINRYIQRSVKPQTKRVPIAAILSQSNEPGSVYTYTDCWLADGFVYGIGVMVPEKGDARGMMFEAATTIISPDGERSLSSHTQGSPGTFNITKLAIGKDDGEYTLQFSFEVIRSARRHRVSSSVLILNASPSVSLGNWSVSPAPPNPIATSSGQATITVSILTTTEVPSTAVATVELNEASNFNNISYFVSPSRSQTVDLKGGGESTTVTWTINTHSRNAAEGNIVSRIRLVSASTCRPTTTGCKEEAIALGQPTMSTDLTVVVANPGTGGGDVIEGCLILETCGGTQFGCYFDPVICVCECSPLLIDILGDNFSLTSPADGVQFDINGDGILDRMAWTSADSDDAFLALDRNQNGVIDNGAELFGSFTPQPQSTQPNGFVALAEFDKFYNGGNNNGILDSGDSMYASLRLWQDANHNGISEPGELHTLQALGVDSIDLLYKESRRQDRHGNWFRYRGRVEGTREPHGKRWCYDIYLLKAQ